MKTSSRMNGPALLAAGGLLILSVGSRAVLAKGGDACKLTSKSAAQACAAEAKADFALALGKCANIADPIARKACQDQAKADVKERWRNARISSTPGRQPANSWAPSLTIR